ncbi:MAG: 6-carboxytetrahydropterin synthase QueD [Oscillospiraceae bacterium]|nr:6-carboxytetrahydropterin synthase QueD [Oscillospiraceae bacterium]
MYQLKTSASFDSAHFLSGYHGKCANLHGHHWMIEVCIQGEMLQTQGDKKGMLLDFGDFKKIIRNLADDFDHALIYEENSLKDTTISALQQEHFRLISVPFPPTAENFAKHFFALLRKQNLPVYQVTVYETPDNCAVYQS